MSKENKTPQKSNWTAVLAAVVVVIGWPIGHWLNSERDRTNKLREVRINYLINAYRDLANASQRFPETNSPYFRSIESAVADIQLFGTPNQIQTIHSLLPIYRKTGQLPLDPLLNDIRNNLRDDLRIPHVSGNVEWLRMDGVPILPKSQIGDVLPMPTSASKQ